MDNKDLVIAIIPARGGSKGIVGKNTKLFAGKPLISYVIAAARDSGVVDKVFVSTDDREIKEVAKEFGAEVVPQDCTEGAQGYDLSKESYLLSSILNIERLNIRVKDIIFLQATSPLTSSEDVRLAYEKYVGEELDSVFAATDGCGGFKCGNNMWGENNTPLWDYKNRKPRQLLSKVFLENGAFYIFSRDGLFKHRNRIHGKFDKFMMPSFRSFEIDEPEDWKIGEHFMKYLEGEKKSVSYFAIKQEMAERICNPLL